jgi:acyl carrier protein
MSRQQIFDQVCRIIAERLRVATAVEPGTDLARDLQLDSVQQLTLVVELENHFQICFDPGEEEGIATVDSVVQLIASRLAGGRVCEEPAAP